MQTCDLILPAQPWEGCAGRAAHDKHGTWSLNGISVGLKQPQTLPFAALGVHQKHMPAALAIDTAHTSHRLQRQQDEAVWFDLEDDEAPRPEPIGRKAKHAKEEVRLTPRIILTPMRESDKRATGPRDGIPLRADSVRRKRKHKMNKHKHKKRRKLQRHKN